MYTRTMIPKWLRRCIGRFTPAVASWGERRVRRFGAVDSAALLAAGWLLPVSRWRLTWDVVDQTADAVGVAPGGTVRVGATVWADDDADDPIDDPIADAIDRAAGL